MDTSNEVLLDGHPSIIIFFKHIFRGIHWIYGICKKPIVRTKAWLQISVNTFQKLFLAIWIWKRFQLWLGSNSGITLQN